MKWIESSGGPLICLEEKAALHWKGIYGLSLDTASIYGNDYERACAAKEYISPIVLNNGNALILGDEPMSSSFIYTIQGEFCIVRWMYSESEDIEDFLYKLNGRISNISEPIQYEVRQGKIILFEARLSGEDLDDFLSGNINSGFYKITTEEFQNDEKDFKFIIHRFQRIK